MLKGRELVLNLFAYAVFGFMEFLAVKLKLLLIFLLVARVL